MKGKLDGSALRVPDPDRLADRLHGQPAKKASVEEINAAFAKAAEAGR